jgi:hypothetical protein
MTSCLSAFSAWDLSAIWLFVLTVPELASAASAPEKSRLPDVSLIVLFSVVLLPSAVAMFLAKLSATPSGSVSTLSSS